METYTHLQGRGSCGGGGVSVGGGIFWQAPINNGRSRASLAAILLASALCDYILIIDEASHFPPPWFTDVVRA